MRTIALWALIAILMAAGGARAQTPALTTDEEKTAYTLGVLHGQNLLNYSLTEAEMGLVKAGIADGALKRTPQVDVQAFIPKARELQPSRIRQRAEVEKKIGQEFLAKAAAEPGATKTPSGLVMASMANGCAPGQTSPPSWSTAITT